MKCQNNVGFTLIELLVVVLIIGILAAVALPQYTKAVERSRTAEAIQRMGDVATALQIAYMQNGSFPANHSAADFKNMDLTFGDSLDTNSYTITYASADGSSGVITSQRKGGQYIGSELTLTVNGNGTIEKACSDATGKAGLCGLTTSAGYKS